MNLNKRLQAIANSSNEQKLSPEEYKTHVKNLQDSLSKLEKHHSYMNLHHPTEIGSEYHRNIERKLHNFNPILHHTNPPKSDT